MYIKLSRSNRVKRKGGGGRERRREGDGGREGEREGEIEGGTNGLTSMQRNRWTSNID